MTALPISRRLLELVALWSRSLIIERGSGRGQLHPLPLLVARRAGYLSWKRAGGLDVPSAVVTVTDQQVLACLGVCQLKMN